MTRSYYWTVTCGLLLALATPVAAQDKLKCADKPKYKECKAHPTPKYCEKKKEGCPAPVAVKTYCVADLIVPIPGHDPTDHVMTERLLIDLITRMIAPGSWSDNDAPGKIEYSPLQMSLVVRQSALAHEQISKLLAALRQFAPKEYTLEMMWVQPQPGEADQGFVLPKVTLYEGQKASISSPDRFAMQVKVTQFEAGEAYVDLSLGVFDRDKSDIIHCNSLHATQTVKLGQTVKLAGDKAGKRDVRSWVEITVKEVDAESPSKAAITATSSCCPDQCKAQPCCQSKQKIAKKKKSPAPTTACPRELPPIVYTPEVLPDPCPPAEVPPAVSKHVPSNAIQQAVYNAPRPAPIPSEPAMPAFGVMPIGNCVWVGTIAPIWIQGATSLESTGQQFDVAIEGEGFFQIAHPDGKLRYTREGSFHVNTKNQIVNANGYPLEPAITIPADTIHISIGADGTVSVLQAGTPTVAAVVGIITYARFHSPLGLMRSMLEPHLFLPGPSSGKPIVGQPGVGGTGLGLLRQGYREVLKK